MCVYVVSWLKKFVNAIWYTVFMSAFWVFLRYSQQIKIEPHFHLRTSNVNTNIELKNKNNFSVQRKKCPHSNVNALNCLSVRIKNVMRMHLYSLWSYFFPSLFRLASMFLLLPFVFLSLCLVGKTKHKHKKLLALFRSETIS